MWRYSERLHISLEPVSEVLAGMSCVSQEADCMTDTEINEAVARKLGFERDPQFKQYFWKDYGNAKCFRVHEHFMDYCHDIKAAWEIFLWVRSQTFSTRMKFAKAISDQTYEGDIKIDPFYWMLFNSNPMAIVLAFLKLP